uniref:Protein F n=1 Tax=hepatitis C virus genotype 1a TaxID=2847144 RepID=B1PPK9_9HEPC|nr:protein F [hepatitis C virus genotype 1a]
MSTNPKPQKKKPELTPTVAHRTSSSRVAVRSLVEFTCCRAGALGWVCAPRGRLPSGRNLEVDASLSPRHVGPRVGPGPSPGTLGPSMAMRAAVGRGGSCPPVALGLVGAPQTPGVGRAIWVRSSIPSRAASPTSWGTYRSSALLLGVLPGPWRMASGPWKTA